MSRIAVVGPGAVGLTYAVELAGAHEVVLCGRRPVGTVSVERPPGPPRSLSLPTLTDPAALADGPWDWAFVTLKTTQVPGAAAWLAALDRPGTSIAVFQNGIEQRESVAPFTSCPDVLPTIVWSGSELVGGSQLRIMGELRLVVPAGELGRRFAGLFAGSAVEVDTAADFDQQAWHKLLANAVAGLQVLSLRRAAMFHLDDVHELAGRLAEECAQVARATGTDLPEGAVRDIADLYRRIPPDTGTSILYDRVGDRPLEWDARNGVIRRLGRRHGVPTPISDVIVPLLQAASPDSYPDEARAP